MKINVSRIFFDHLNTFRNASTAKVEVSDWPTFYILPALFALAAYYFRFSVKDEFYNVSITFFGIFIALLLNIQVAIFGIFLRKWDLPNDKKSAVEKDERLSMRKSLLAEVNANVSYMVLLSSLSLTMCLLFYTMSYTCGAFSATIVFLYSHFLLTLLMIIKRVHALFQREYIE